MKKRISSIIFLGAGILGGLLTSCRGTDTENKLISGGPTAVTFNLVGTSFSDQNPGAQASVGGKGGAVAEVSVQKQAVLVDPSTVMVAELTPATENNRLSASASVGKGAVAAVPGSPLVSGIKFRVIAYSQTDGSFQAYQDYTVGQQAVPMTLNVGAPYRMIVYSYNTTTLPAITTGEQTNLNGAQVNYDDTNRDFMYYNEGNYIPGEGANVLNITLRHKVTQITTNISYSGQGNISAVANAVLTPHYSDGAIPLSSGSVTGRTTATTGVPLQFSGFPANTVSATPVFINEDSRGNKTGSFKADITTNGVTTTRSFPNSFTITPGYKSNLNINLQNCGAMVGGVWRSFMCYNLGADTTADAFTPAQAVQGAKYQWGVQTGTSQKYFTQAQDQDPANAIPSLSVWNYSITNISPDTSWDGTATGGPNNPCPSGYRVPTQQEWQGVMGNNTMTAVGTWSGIASISVNYGAGLAFGNNIGNTLMLPAAGYRYTGSINGVGNSGFYWTSTPTGGTTQNSFALRFVNNSFNSTPSINIDATSLQAILPKYSGASVRCIAAN